MRALYLANVGNRDVWIDGQPVPPAESRARGEAVLEDFESYRARISAPIAEASLRYLAGRGKPDETVLLSIYLFATNQGPAAGQHREKDTLPFANVLKRYLPGFCARLSGLRLESEAVKVVSISTNPSLFDEMYDAFGRQLRILKPSEQELDCCFVSSAGGVPAANFALLVRAVDHYGEKCLPIYVREGSGRADPLDIGRQLRRSVLRTVARQELANYEFGRAAELLRQLELGSVWVGLAEAARDRLSFDFGSAIGVLEGEVFAQARGAAREAATRLREELEQIASGSNTARIEELFHNARITHAQGRYVDFLLRLFRLQEAVLRHVVETELHLPAGVEEGKANREFVAGIEGSPALLAHVRQPFNGKVLDYKRAPSSALLHHLLNYLATDPTAEDRERFRHLSELLDRLDKLVYLRNQSIGAHGFAGVSDAEIARRYPEGCDLLADLREMVGLAGAGPDGDPFDALRDLILTALERMA